MTITFEINMAASTWDVDVCMFIVGDVLSKLKRFLFNKGKVIGVIV